MANIEMNDGGKGKKNKAKKQTLRVDFTPMVDMNMLLITFFMFCTTLSIPQVMDIAMPVPDGSAPTGASRALTIILDEQDNVYYYEGFPDYEDYTSLKKTDAFGLRQILLQRNSNVVAKIKELQKRYHNKQLSDVDLREQITEAKKMKDSPIVMIKPTDKSNYKNLVDVLDEMQICSVGKYSILDVGDEDRFVLENFKTKGNLTAQIDR